MTPRLIRYALARFIPRKDHLAMLGASALAIGIGLLALLYPWLASYSLFFAWPFLCTSILVFGLLVMAALYRNAGSATVGTLHNSGLQPNEVLLYISAPFFTFWFIGGLALLVGGTLLGFLNLYWWLMQST